jgi:hypothetical protein
MRTTTESVFEVSDVIGIILDHAISAHHNGAGMWWGWRVRGRGGGLRGAEVVTVRRRRVLEGDVVSVWGRSRSGGGGGRERGGGAEGGAEG